MRIKWVSVFDSLTAIDTWDSGFLIRWFLLHLRREFAISDSEIPKIGKLKNERFLLVLSENYLFRCDSWIWGANPLVLAIWRRDLCWSLFSVLPLFERPWGMREGFWNPSFLVWSGLGSTRLRASPYSSFTLLNCVLIFLYYFYSYC